MFEPSRVVEVDVLLLHRCQRPGRIVLRAGARELGLAVDRGLERAADVAVVLVEVDPLDLAVVDRLRELAVRELGALGGVACGRVVKRKIATTTPSMTSGQPARPRAGGAAGGRRAGLPRSGGSIGWATAHWGVELLVRDGLDARRVTIVGRVDPRGGLRSGNDAPGDRRDSRSTRRAAPVGCRVTAVPIPTRRAVRWGLGDVSGSGSSAWSRRGRRLDRRSGPGPARPGSTPTASTWRSALFAAERRHPRSLSWW